MRLAAEKTRPTKTPAELLDDLARAGVPQFANEMRAIISTSQPASDKPE